jgi:hypothetical protein
MPKWRFMIHGWITPREVEAASKEDAERIVTDIIKAGYDKRYWGFEIYAYSVNGEDF